MARPVVELLIAADDDTVDLDELFAAGRDPAEFAAVASEPLAPLAVAPLLEALNESRNGIEALLTGFVFGLGQQHSYLAFRDTTDALLDGPPLPAAVLTALHEAMVTNHPADPTGHLTAARLEVALRIVASGAAPKYRLMAELANPAFRTDPQASLICMLIGTAHQLVADATDRAHLSQVLDQFESTADTDFTRALISLGEVAASTDEATVVDGLSAVANQLRSIADRDENRDDARAYAAACTAVTAFASGDQEQLREASAQARLTSTRRALGHHRAHRRLWTQPRRAAEIAWTTLAIRLDEAAGELAHNEFLNTFEAVDALLAVYTADHSRPALAGTTHTVIRPAIENRLAARVSMVRQLQRLVDDEHSKPDRRLPPEAAQLLAASKQAKERQFRTRPTAPPDDSEWLHLTHLKTLLDGDLSSIAGLDPEILRRLDAMADLAAWSGLVDTAGARHEVLDGIEESILDDLSENPAFHSQAGRDIALLVDATLTFMSLRHDTPAEYMRQLAKGDKRPGEEVLQTDYSTIMKVVPALRGRVGVEHADIAGGRADVHFQFDEARRYVAEIKRELRNAGRAAVEKAYLGQTLTYQTAGPPFGLLLVLDLTDHTTGWPELRDSIWVHHTTSPAGSTRSVIVGIVAGNRPHPNRVKVLQPKSSGHSAPTTSASGRFFRPLNGCRHA